MQTYLEQWLRLMLRWDPKARGGGLAKDKRPACFTMLDNILAMKVSVILPYEPRHEKTCPRGWDQVRLKLACSATEAS